MICIIIFTEKEDQGNKAKVEGGRWKMEDGRWPSAITIKTQDYAGLWMTMKNKDEVWQMANGSACKSLGWNTLQGYMMTDDR